MAWHRIRPLVFGVPLVFLAWGLSLVVLTLFEPPGKPLAVFARGGVAAALDTVVAAGGDILQVRNGTVLAISDDAGFVGRLYREGALVVLLSDVGGCIVRSQRAPVRSASLTAG